MNEHLRQQAVELRAQGLGYKRIAKATGVPLSTVARWVNPELAEREREAARAWKRRCIGACERCGAATRYNGNTVNGASRLCRVCGPKAAAETNTVWTRERLIDALNDAAAVLGRTPGVLDFSPGDTRARLGDEDRARRSKRMIAAGRWPSHSSFYRCFGSFSAALEAAGYTPLPPHGSVEGMKRRRRSRRTA